ncbi:NlpC/P60 family protein [Actinokineospora xionganensis]|uniref:C40 family peptidase n=1 Tax=Actinokineospora xionganensis TaxID=2684470 RepID=A0ABR7L5A9_9PSEU|nr:NlpC/P60 family protein [Actinokineospora xionganensis]MBC6447872.1 C40 family peptidase [Actinokineospora xionganensis]
MSNATRRPATGVAVGSLVVVVALAALAVWLLTNPSRPQPPPTIGAGTTPSAAQPAGTPLVFDRLTGPARTVVREGGRVLAVFTDGARTVTLDGPKRTFAEPAATKAAVHTTTWVRLAPQPWQAGQETAAWFADWFPKARADTSADVLEVATQYVIDAPADKDGDGVRYRGDASFGPVKATGAGRKEQSDFFDYLGKPWSFPDAKGDPDSSRYGAVDCSGFVRLVYGYRMGMPLLGTNDPGPGLPRRAYAIADHGPGVELVPNKRARASAYGVLQPGDLVFFEVEDGPETLDHVGIYIGIDDGGHHRFISSRERIDGPTLGDVGGTSLLDDGGHYSTAWRAARRL